MPEQTRLEEIVSSFTGCEVAVVGDLILDEFVWGRVSRISPEAPVPIVEVNRETTCLGGAANVALNLAALGVSSYLVGVVGGDLPGEKLLHLLRDFGIRDEGVIRAESRKTTVKTRIIAHHQQVCRTDREYKTPFGTELRERLVAMAERKIDCVNGVVLSDYAKGVLDGGTSARLIEHSTKQGRFVAVDPKTSDFSSYRGASVITPNKKEAESASAVRITDSESLLEAGQKIIDSTAAENLLITRGDEGMTLFEGGRALEIPTVAKEVFDVTGAGDTVIAVLTLGMAAGASLYEAAVLANHAAGVVVGKLGTASVSVEELLESISAGSEILSEGA